MHPSSVFHLSAGLTLVWRQAIIGDPDDSNIYN